MSISKVETPKINGKRVLTSEAEAKKNFDSTNLQPQWKQSWSYIEFTATGDEIFSEPEMVFAEARLKPEIAYFKTWEKIETPSNPFKPKTGDGVRF